MNDKKFSQLLSAATAISVTLECSQKQISDFANQSVSRGAELEQQIIKIGNSLQAIAINPPPLGKVDTDTLAKLKLELNKIKSSLQKDIEAPGVSYKKEIDKLSKKIQEKILAETRKPCNLNLDPINKQVIKAQAALKEINAGLDRSFISIGKCQGTLVQLEEKLNRLNLANDLEAAAKQISKVVKNLAELNDQLLKNPGARDQYPQQFIALHATLGELKVQAEAIAAPSIPAPRPAP